MALYFAHLTSDWWVIKVSNIRIPDFVDLGYVISGHNFCSSGEPNVSLRELLFVYSCDEYVYGRVLAGITWQFPLILDLMPHLSLIAALMGLTLVVAIALSLSQDPSISISRGIVISWLVFSPPVLLLLERANIDIVIALLVIIASVGLTRGWWLLAVLVLFISSVIKFYTLPLLWFLALSLESRIGRFFALATASFSTVIILQDVLRVSSRIPDGGYVQFGFPVLVHYFERLGVQDTFGVFKYLGLVVPVVIAVFVAHSTKLKPLILRYKLKDRVSLIEVISTISGIVFLACYLTGLSFDYRLVFLLIAGVAYILRDRTTTAVSAILWTLLAVSLWGSTALGLGWALDQGGPWVWVVGVAQALGDASTMAWAGILLGSGVKGLQNTYPGLRILIPISR
jgi:hypothetical protein